MSNMTDSAHCDFALLSKVEKKLRQHRFQTSKEMFAVYNNEVSMVLK